MEKAIVRPIFRLLLVSLLAHPYGANSGPDAPFDFVVIGCMPYSFPEDDQRFRNLIDEVNSLNPAFTVHCGDTKGGQAVCSDESLLQVYAYFHSFDHPLFYSIGDNEWTDCHRPNCGGYDPLERLAFVRDLFFPTPVSLGAVPFPLESQRVDPLHGRHVENTRWVMGNIVFACVHVVGSNNNCRHEDPAALEEFNARDAANTAWIEETFAQAVRDRSLAVAIFVQANPFDAAGNARGEGFTRFIETLRGQTLCFGGPVVLFHADSHYFRVDKPLKAGPTGPLLESFTRVETFGSQNMHAVVVTVDPTRPDDPFTFRPRLIQKNRRVPTGAP